MKKRRNGPCKPQTTQLFYDVSSIIASMVKMTPKAIGLVSRIGMLQTDTKLRTTIDMFLKPIHFDHNSQWMHGHFIAA
jgi:hypothetical protein